MKKDKKHKMNTRAYIYKLKPVNNDHINYAAAILSMVCVETLLVIEHLNNCINQIINH